MTDEKQIEISLDEDDLTLGELEILEEVVGQLDSENVSQAKMTVALTLVALRREDPSATVEDARAVKVSRLVRADEAEVSSAVGPTD